MKHCPHCNSKLKNADRFCPKCGLPISHSESPELKKERSAKKVRLAPIFVSIIAVLGIAVVLLFFLGSKPFSDDPEAIAEASQSVVKLNCYDKSGSLYATGSGFACFEDNIIVTNYHVIQDNVYKIEASTEAGEKFIIKSVLVADEKQDIAILATASPHGLQLLQPGDCKTIQKGEKVVAIGSPLGLLNSVSTGVFSGYVKESGVDVLQFTASISSGSSGGALFNDSGEVLGITFSSYDEGQNLNLAIPISAVSKLWENKNSSKAMTVEQFYDTFPHIVTADYVIANAKVLNRQEVTVEGYVSYTYGYTYRGESSCSFGLVGNRADVFGYVFTDYDWDYSAAAASHGQERAGIAIYVIFNDYPSVTQFLNKYKPGTLVTCTGTVEAYSDGTCFLRVK